MKKAFTLALVVFVGAVTLLQAANDRIIQFAQLPNSAKVFVNKFFKGKQVSYIKDDREIISTNYELRLADGTEIDFDSKGNWTDVDGKHQAIPVGLIPAAILKTVSKQHPSDSIVKIERTRFGYEVKLLSGLEIQLNKQGAITGYDD